MGFLHPFPTKGFQSAQMFASIPKFFATPRVGAVLKDQLQPLVISLVWLFLHNVLHVPDALSTKFSLLPLDCCRLLGLLEGSLGAGV